MTRWHGASSRTRNQLGIDRLAMLRSLYIRDYAIIEELEVSFGDGLNIITGETGAGKSILVGALKMILGERASTEVVRSGASKAVIEGIFDHVESELLAERLRENQIDVLDHIILRREISSTQSRAFINDSPATVSLMREVASDLIDLHGQHEHQSLLHTETHGRLLDAFGGLDDLVLRYRELLGRVREKERERERLIGREQELSRQKDLYEFQIEEIDRVGPREGEDESIEAELRILEHAEYLFESTGRLYESLYESDAALHDQLVAVRDTLADLARIDAAFGPSMEEVRSAQIVIAELASFLQEYNANVEYNPERLEELRSRLGDLELLKRKYGGTLSAVLGHREEIGAAFTLAADFSGAIERVSGEIRAAEQEMSDVAWELSDRRHDAARRIEEAVVSELARLGIANARFEVRLDAYEAPDGNIHSRDGKIRFRALSRGVDDVSFLLSTNVGEQPRPLARVASGGEVSRVMLALKSVLARSERLPILVFDEIDTGVSGQIAQKVGESMRDLAASHQIIAITHLPQIAAMGTHHFLVEKLTSDGRTKTRMRALDDSERTAEIAALMSGSEITDAALESARELIASRR